MGSLAMEGGDHDQPLQVVMFPSLGFGHIFPFIHFSNALAANGVKITFLTLPSLVPKIRLALDPTIPILNYKLPAIDGLPSDVDSTAGSGQVLADLLSQALDATRPQIATILGKLAPQVVVFDSIQGWVPEVAESLGIKSVYFCVFTAITAASTILFGLTPHQRPSLSRLRLPPRPLLSSYLSMKPYEVRGMLSNTNGSGPAPSNFSRLVSCMARCDAIALKSVYEMEASVIKYLSTRCRKPVLPTGVLLPKAPAGDIEPKLTQWLNKFPKGTVVFCSFGSESYLSGKQMKELVVGLELSGFPFLAVLNTPADVPKGKRQELEDEIFGEKAEGRGIVRSGWVNQQLILRHPAVGCYVNHAGYSSIMEAVEGGCQLVMAPLKGDQYMNMKLMVVELRAAVNINRRAWDGWFTREAVGKAVRTVMVEGSKKGKVVRANNAKLREILLQEGLQEDYTKGFITKLKELVASP
ncbi:anthocyanidin-3-O-glucoside rhamnosyltransferase-like [Nymphaea colorata]|uniref:Glycosyltransferase n=1 Tax=Nymphaea colorata TaxID=210225 RepID=A0A5K1A0Y0_9MAGN|nr:anthocyanidin-3-O-glucoside rhamnosyltransferase-like [Nymphaea colorata]